MSETREKAAAMHEATDIGTLIERVEASTGADPALDHAIYEALRPANFGAMQAMYDAGDVDGYWFWMSPGRYTGSIDAAARLIEKIRPGHGWTITLFPLEGEPEKPFWAGITSGAATCGAWGETSALAMISALLRSLQEKSHG